MPIALDLYYHVYDGGSEKPPMVLIHGAGSSHLCWPGEIRRLAGSRVYALDLPGHGKSGGRGLQSLAAYGQAITAWLEAVNLSRAVFVGHSMGGAIALQLALDHPDQVLGLGLISSAARLPIAPELMEMASNPTTLPNAIEIMTLNACTSPTALCLVEPSSQQMAATRPSVLYGDLLTCAAFDATQRLTEVKQPTLVLCGAEDKLTPVRQSQHLASHIPGATLEIIPGASHLVMLEQPHRVAKRLAAFLTWVGSRLLLASKQKASKA